VITVQYDITSLFNEYESLVKYKVEDFLPSDDINYLMAWFLENIILMSF
jgi:hypothetical protein